MRKLIIALLLVALLAGCAKPPEPTPTPEPTATNTPEPTSTPEPTVDPTIAIYRQQTVEQFNAINVERGVNCAGQWDYPEEFKIICIYETEPFAADTLIMLAHTYIETLSKMFLTEPVSVAVPDDFTLTIISNAHQDNVQVMVKTSLSTLRKMFEGRITLQIEWEQEAEIVK